MKFLNFFDKRTKHQKIREGIFSLFCKYKIDTIAASFMLFSMLLEIAGDEIARPYVFKMGKNLSDTIAEFKDLPLGLARKMASEKIRGFIEELPIH